MGYRVVQRPRIRRHPLRQLPVVVLTCIAACSSEEGQSPRRLTVQDSASIRIVSSASPCRVIEDLSTLGTPITTLGADIQTPIGTISDADILSSGTVVFVDTQSGELSAFLPSEEIRVWARRGPGAQEIQFPVNLQRLRGDSVQIYDRRQAKIMVFDSGGAFAYSVSFLMPDRPPPRSVYRLEDSLFLGLFPQFERRRIVATALDADLGFTPEDLVVLRASGEVRNAIPVEAGSYDVRIPGSSLPPAYGATTPFSTTPDGAVAYGTGETPIVSVWTSRGEHRATFRLNASRGNVDRDSLNSLLRDDHTSSARIGVPPDELPVTDPAFLPDSIPAFKTIRRFGETLGLGSAEPFFYPSRSWEILSASGEWLISIDLPDQAELLDISYGKLVLKRVGSHGQHFLEIYRLDESFERC